MGDLCRFPDALRGLCLFAKQMLFSTFFAHETCIAVSSAAPHWSPSTLHSLLVGADLQQVNI